MRSILLFIFHLLLLTKQSKPMKLHFFFKEAIPCFLVFLFPLILTAQWTEEQKILAQIPGVDFYTNPSDEMGKSVSVDGDFALVGVPNADLQGSNSGMALLYHWDGSEWIEEQVLLAEDGEAGDQFGYSLSISGNIALVGAWEDDDNGDDSGSAYVFENNGSGDWAQVAKLLPDDGATLDRFGESVSISGNTAIIGVSGDDDNGPQSGSVYVFEKDGLGNWTQGAKLLPDDGGTADHFGYSVSLADSTMLIGAFEDDNKGSAYIFKKESSGVWNQTTKLFSDDGATDDRFGWSVSLSGNTALVGSVFDDENGENSGSAYIFEEDDLGGWNQVAKLIPDDGAASDFFGFSVSVSGNAILIGAFEDDDNGSSAGSAYIFERDSNDIWTQVSKLLPDDVAAGDEFGRSVSVSGNSVLVGARLDDDNGADSGSAYVLKKDEFGNWSQSDKLLPNDGVVGNYFGNSVSVSGSSAVVGAQRDDDNGSDSGSAYIFEKDDSGNWSQVAKLLPQDGATLDRFGMSVSISGQASLIGAFEGGDNGFITGSAYVFEKDITGSWIQTAKLLPNDGALFDQFGVSVSISGNTALVGANSDDDNGSQSGSAYVFEKDETGIWSQVAKLLPDDGEANDSFGISVSLSENKAIVGANRNDDNGANSGSAYIFEKDGSGSWVQAGIILPNDGEPEDSFRTSVSISENTALIGADRDDDNGTDSGSAYVFEKDDFGNWIQTFKLLPNDGSSADFFGSSVSILGNTALVGAFFDNDNGSNSGSAYVFEKDGFGNWSQAAKLLPGDGALNDNFGYSVSVSGNIALVGARSDDDSGIDSGSAFFFSRDVCVSDTTAPIITACPTDTVVLCLSDIPSYDVSLVSATDECTVTITHLGDASDGQVPPTITRTYRVKDEAGNFMDCIQSFTVEDTIAPILTCPSDITEFVSGSATDLVVNFIAPVATDNCGITAIETVPASGSLFPIGTTLVTTTATDEAGNESICTFNVTIAVQCEVDGGELSVVYPLEFSCVDDGLPNFLEVNADGEQGPLTRYGIANANTLNLIEGNNNGIFNLENYPKGEYFIFNVSYVEPNLFVGASNLADLEGCFDLSNYIHVSTFNVDGGIISLTEDSLVCLDDEIPSILDFDVTGNRGPNQRWAVLNENGSSLLAHNSSGIFNFDLAPIGVYRVIHAAWGETNPGSINLMNPEGCVDFSEPIFIYVENCNSQLLELKTEPNPTTGISFVELSSNENDQASLEVYDISGRFVESIFSGMIEKDEVYRFQFDGSGLPNGVYIYRLTTRTKIRTTKFIVAH
jgi:hypothetical protein